MPTALPTAPPSRLHYIQQKYMLLYSLCYCALTLLTWKICRLTNCVKPTTVRWNCKMSMVKLRVEIQVRLCSLGLKVQCLDEFGVTSRSKCHHLFLKALYCDSAVDISMNCVCCEKVLTPAGWTWNNLLKYSLPSHTCEGCIHVFPRALMDEDTDQSQSHFYILCQSFCEAGKHIHKTNMVAAVEGQKWQDENCCQTHYKEL